MLFQKRVWFLRVPIFVMMLLLVSQIADFGAQTEFRTAASASDGCMLAAVEGSFVADAQNVLKRINEIRKEACDQGIPDPRDRSRKLTSADYSPIRWSASLEYIARVRAVEAGIYMDHTRPNGTACFSVSAPDGVSSYGEVLAWNLSSGMLSGINQWYEEKYDWVHNTAGAVTGHYTQMIDPSNLYVGVATFLNKEAYFYNTTAGEFSSLEEAGSSTAPMAAVDDCKAVIEIVKEALSSPKLVKTGESLQKKGSLDKGDKIRYSLGMKAFAGTRFESLVYDAGSITWTSDAPSVATVNATGKVVINNVGKAVIKAVSDQGTFSITVNPAHTESWAVQKQATRTVTGTRVKKCSVCGEILRSADIYPIGEVSVAKDTYTYTGKNLEPAVVLKDSQGNDIPASSYTMVYKNNKNVGAAQIVVTFQNRYSGKETVRFYIRPKKVGGVSAKGKKKSAAVQWKKAKETVSGYQVEYSLKKDFSKSRTVNVKKSAASCTLKKLKAKKAYYVRVRSYFKVDGKKLVSVWSKVIKVKTK